MKLLIIGAGSMGREYAKVLKALGLNEVSVLSRKEQSAKQLAQEFSLENYYGGGIQQLSVIVDSYDAFIVCVPIEQLLPYLILLSKHSKQQILVEKPVCLSSQELMTYTHAFPGSNAKVALNRLYFSSIDEFQRRVNFDDITSVEFSFTEWVHDIDVNKYPERVLSYWGLSNSIHVISTVFHLLGLPDTLYCIRGGKNKVAWHSNAAIFNGCGITERGIPFCYSSDWTSSGRWSIRINTCSGSYDFKPMESLAFIPKGSIRSEVLYEYNDDLKCGFKRMLQDWLSDTHGPLSLDMPQLTRHVKVIEEIFGY